MNIFDSFRDIELTIDQHKALDSIENFLNGSQDVFILNGYAGSGKTTLLKGLTKYLGNMDKNFQLMAPTGRAAKVIEQKTAIIASTIHKVIYNFAALKELKENGHDENVSYKYYFALRNDQEVHRSVLIVDEASMISDVDNKGEFFRFGSGFLLKDLLSYAHINIPNASAKIIFIGDSAQLPPVGMNFSPALDKEYLEKNYELQVETAEMKEVVRQDAGNGILVSSDKIRKSLTSKYFNEFDLSENGKDIFNPSFADFYETYQADKDSKIIITYKNKTALDVNQAIRYKRFGEWLPVQKGDTIIIGANNYNLGIMNGEFGMVLSADKDTISRKVSFNTSGGVVKSVLLTWRGVELLMQDNEIQGVPVKGFMLENFLTGDNDLSPEVRQALYIDFKNRNPGIKPKTPGFSMALKSDPFFNAILLKYGYAVTCHKAQGGEWGSAYVFWDKGVSDQFNHYEQKQNRTGKTNADFYRWAYTAVTRASNRLFAVNPPYFNSFSSFSFIEVDIQDDFEKISDKSVKPIELELGNDYADLLKLFNLQDVSESLQNHFIKIHYLVKRCGINIINRKKVGFEVRYSFERNGEQATIRYWINGKDEVKASFQKIPSGTNSDALYNEIAGLIQKQLSSIVVNRSAMKNTQKIIKFEPDLEEKMPFLSSLYNNLSNQSKRFGIGIAKLTHHNFRERYVFERGEEKAVVDFIYNGNGFFGNVLPMSNQCNSSKLLKEIKTVVNNIKEDKYVV